MISKKLPEDVQDQLLEDIKYEAAHAGHEYVDNFRAYRYKDELGKSDFIKTANQGCCGNAQSHTIIKGEKYIIGWNYGY